MFIGVQSKTSIIVNLIACGLFLGFGLYLSITHSHLLDSPRTCSRAAISIIIAISSLMGLYTITNLYLWWKHKLDPRRRKWFNRAVVCIRWFGVVSNIVILSLLFNYELTLNTFPCIGEENYLITYFLFTFMILVVTELFFLTILILVSAVLLCFVTCLVCCGFTIQLEQQSPEEPNMEDPGTPYLNRTQVETFQNISMGLLGNQTDRETQCPICLEQYTEQDQLRKMPCNHYYHQECIDSWLEHHSECPICKQNIRDGQPQFA